MNEPKPATPPPDPSSRARPAGSLRTWVTGAVAATVFGVGGFFAVQALTTHPPASPQCSSNGTLLTSRSAKGLPVSPACPVFLPLVPA